MERTLHMLIYRVFHAQRSAIRPYLGELGLGAGQPKLLGYLKWNGASGQRQLADYYEIDPAAVCRMLDSLEKGGFVTRRPDSQDKRRDLIELTDAGRTAFDSWQARCRKVEETMLAGFTPEERDNFADYLARAYRNLKAERGQQT
jgi:DNA-binding MarR family transcriptional regulator